MVRYRGAAFDERLAKLGKKRLGVKQGPASAVRNGCGRYP
jgi:hypothetical protein